MVQYYVVADDTGTRSNHTPREGGDAQTPNQRDKYTQTNIQPRSRGPLASSPRPRGCRSLGGVGALARLVGAGPPKRVAKHTGT